MHSITQLLGTVSNPSISPVIEPSWIGGTLFDWVALCVGMLGLALAAFEFFSRKNEFRPRLRVEQGHAFYNTGTQMVWIGVFNEGRRAVTIQSLFLKNELDETNIHPVHFPPGSAELPCRIEPGDQCKILMILEDLRAEAACDEAGALHVRGVATDGLGKQYVSVQPMSV